MTADEINLLRTFEQSRKVYVDADPDWRLIESMWRASYLMAGTFGADDGGVWQVFSLSETSRKLINSRPDWGR